MSSLDTVTPLSQAVDRVGHLADALAQLPQAMAEVDALGGDPMRAFADGLPPGFVASLVQTQPLLGSLFLALGVPIE